MSSVGRAPAASIPMTPDPTILDPGILDPGILDPGILGPDSGTLRPDTVPAQCSRCTPRDRGTGMETPLKQLAADRFAAPFHWPAYG